MYHTDSQGAQRPKPSQKLPQYLMVRGSTYYFKRRIPAGLENEFPEARSGQVWRSLETDLLSKARVMLEAELAQFNLRVAAARRAAAVQRKSELTAVGDSQHHNHPAPIRSAPPQATVARVTPVTSPARAASSHVAPAPKGPHYTLHHLLAAWKQTQTRYRTVNAYATAVNEFQEMHGRPAAQSITREHARTYRDRLIERSLSRGTVANRIGFLATLFRFGQSELIEQVSGNPFERIAVVTAGRVRVAKERRACTVEELNAIYSNRVFTSGHRPHGQVGEAAFWAPLLGPFVGRRLEEIAQLQVADIQSVNGVWCIRISDQGDDQHLKTLSSFRRVPIHQELLRCGFLGFVEKQKAAGHRRLFSDLSNDNANKTWSNALGKWFARLLDEVGLTDPALDYHSFRYTFKQQCSLCGIATETRDALTGHWVGRSDAGRVYLRAEERQYPFPQLVQAMRRLRYRELQVGHLREPTASHAKSV